MGEIPCVVTSVQRGGPSTGLPTKVAQGDVNQARWGVHGDHAIIVLTASSVQDVFAMTVEGFNMAETYRTPVILLFDEVVGHMRERLDMPEPGELPVVERLRTSVKAGVNYYPYLPREDGRLPMSDFGGVHRYNVTGLYHDIWGFPTEQPEAVNKLLYHLVDKIEAKAAEIARWKEYFLDDAQQVFVSYGSGPQCPAPCAYAAREGHPGGPAGIADPLAVPGGTRARPHRGGAQRLRGGNEHGAHHGAGQAGGLEAG